MGSNEIDDLLQMINARKQVTKYIGQFLSLTNVAGKAPNSSATYRHFHFLSLFPCSFLLFLSLNLTHISLAVDYTHAHFHAKTFFNVFFSILTPLLKASPL